MSSVQECAAGLVEVHRGSGRLAFVAPPLVRSGPVEEAVLAQTLGAVGVDPEQVVDAAWVDNGPGWLGILLDSPYAVLGAQPDSARAAGTKVGLAARYPGGTGDDGVALEVRAFHSDGLDLAEDPVTGSLNAGLAQWLVPSGHVPDHYVAAQGTAIGRTGRCTSTSSTGRSGWVGPPGPSSSASARSEAATPAQRTPGPLSGCCSRR